MEKTAKKQKSNEKKDSTEVAKYDPAQIEKKWQKVWQENNIHKFSENPQKEKYYPLVELPYPSGDLHIGHWFSFATADVHARVAKMKGKNVFFTNGFDAFGLPAENAAIKRGVHPKDWTMGNIATMKKQFDQMGTIIDWSHETITCLPEYYKWNQWIFIEMFKKGLAYRAKALTNWCPKDMTVLANENIENGKCWRCGTEVIQKEIEQWFLKLTAYADKLIWPENPQVDWPTSVKVAQNQWIGKKEGIEIVFNVADSEKKITVFTTTPINFGATFLVIAPEHEIVKKITTPKQKGAVEKYINEANKKTEMDRMTEVKDKTGVFTGSYVINHLTGQKIPVWVADYALINYGTGAVQGCPAHDQRDFEFAKKFGISIPRVVTGPNGEIENPTEYADQIVAGVTKGKMINSDFLNGMEFADAMKKTMDYFEKKGWGKRTVNYHIHDWSISRQRYWGTPVPMVHCPKCGIVPVPEEQLPVELPYNVDFAPKGEPPLATAKEWIKTKCPKCKGNAKRDSETLDTFFDSSWYFFRYLNPGFDKGPFPKDLAKKLLPVDIYFGGAEHTLGHTLYARFFTKFFKDLGLIEFYEFAKKRVQHGVILGTDGHRMSKSKGNVVNPDEVVKEYGADAVRLYLCFMMPYEATAPWNPGGMWGVYRFLKRIWDLQTKLADKSLTAKDLFEMHSAIKKVGEDAGSTKFNTGVSTLMKWLNYLCAKEEITREEYKTFLLLLSPFAPHIAEELWQNVILNKDSLSKFNPIHQQSFPLFDKKFLQEEELTIVVQINGKVRDNIIISSDNAKIKENIEKIVKESEKIKKYLQDKKIIKSIYIQGKLLNFVIV